MVSSRLPRKSPRFNAVVSAPSSEASSRFSPAGNELPAGSSNTRSGVFTSDGSAERTARSRAIVVRGGRKQKAGEDARFARLIHEAAKVSRPQWPGLSRNTALGGPNERAPDRGPRRTHSENAQD